MKSIMLIWPINQSKEFPKYLNPILILQNRLTRGLGPERSRNLSFIQVVQHADPDINSHNLLVFKVA